MKIQEPILSVAANRGFGAAMALTGISKGLSGALRPKAGSEVAMLRAVRATFDQVEGVYAGASVLPRTTAGISARILADDAWSLRTASIAVWSCVRK